MRRTGSIIFCICCFIVVLSGCTTMNSDVPRRAEETAPNDVSKLNWKVTDFSFTDHNGQAFGTKNLMGKIWIADFVFTRCPNICPPMVAKMVELQKMLREKNLVIPTVSFSVDPKHDDVNVLKRFAKEHGAGFTNWHFLTGYEQQVIQEIALTCFKGIVEPQKQVSKKYEMLINHPSLLYLVDDSGTVVRFYDGLKPDMQEIIKDIEQLLKRK